MAIICVTMAALGFVLSYLVERQYSAGYHRVLVSHAKLVKGVLEDDCRSGRLPADPDKLCYDLSGKINARVQLLDLNRRVIGDSRRGGTSGQQTKDPAAQLRALGCRVCHPEARGSEALSVEQPIVVAGRTIGETRVSAPLFAIKQTAARTSRIILTALIVAALLAAVLSHRLAASIARPIIDMSRVAGDMARGDLSQRVTVHSDDEIGQLARSFNTMALQLEKMLSEMSEDNDRMETILTTMVDGIVVTDESGTITLFNKASEGIFQRRAEEVVGKSIAEADLHPELSKVVRETLQTQRLARKELRLPGPDRVSLSAYSSPVKDQSLNVRGAVVVLHDLTEIRRHEKAQKEFVANVSHELRTPITAVLVTAEALLSGAKDDPKLLQRFLGTLVSESERLSLLIDDLLEIAKREAGQRKIRKTEVAIRDVVERVFSLCKGAAQRNQITVTVDLPDIVIFADEQQIEQVLANLLDNAIKYTPQGGLVTVTAVEEDESVSLSVSDTGIGIPQGEVSRVFERFYRVDKARSRQLRGTGLGLSIVKDIVEAHGGTVTVQTMLGEGSTFTVTLPRNGSESSEEQD
ncbi:MAG: HAMP domain-containing protein [Armatimonadetes bacterium]|nr:HAMP domain-containing protein [Armatimonadota bacterium]